MLEVLTGPAKAALMTAAVGVLVLGEFIQAPRSARPRDRARRWPLNLVLLGLTLAIGRVLAAFGPVAAAVWAQSEGIGLFHAVAAPCAIAWIASLLAFDLLLYGQHRAMHEVPFLWRLHRVHHTDPTLDVTTAWRFHPFEIALSLVLKGALAILLGAPPAAVALYEVVLALGAAFTHADIRLPSALDRALRVVIATPRVHERHHGVDAADQHTNYSGTLTLWDRLFRTYLAPGRAGIGALGLGGVNAEEAARLGVGLTEPYRTR